MIMAEENMIRSIWMADFENTMGFLDRLLNQFNVLSVDTEFPGFLRTTPRNSSPLDVYNDLRFNVDNTKIIQLGLTLTNNAGDIGGTFEFNFSDFDIRSDRYCLASINLLKESGVDFEKNRKDGIPVCFFAPIFCKVLSRHRNLKWVTFHGLYDLAYLVKLLGFTMSPQPRLPPTMEEFSGVAALFLGCVLDIKVVAKDCPGLRGGELGLSRLAQILNIERHGDAHQAGSDSLLTAAAFAEMKKKYKIDERVSTGKLYGMGSDFRIVMKRPHCHYVQPLYPSRFPVLVHPPQFQTPIHHPPQFRPHIAVGYPHPGVIPRVLPCW